MRFLSILIVVLIASALDARPSLKSEDDFSIDMFDGVNHVRIRRSTDTPAVAGTSVTAQGENGVVALAEKAEKLNLNEAMDLVKSTMDKLNAQNAETVIPKDVAPAVKVEKAAPLAETQVAAVEHNKDAETVIQAGKKFETVISNVEADKVHAKEVETIKSAAPIESVAQEQVAFMNRYGDVLSRINSDHTQKLSTTKQLAGNQFAPCFGNQFASNYGGQQPSFTSRFGSQHQQPTFTSNFGGVQFGQNKQFGQPQQLGAKPFGSPSMPNFQQSGPSTYQQQQPQGQQRARILSGSSPVSRKTISQSMVSFGGQQRSFDFGRPHEATSVLNNRPGQQQYNGAVAGAPQFWSPQQNVRVMNTQGFRF